MLKILWDLSTEKHSKTRTFQKPSFMIVSKPTVTVVCLCWREHDFLMGSHEHMCWCVSVGECRGSTRRGLGHHTLHPWFLPCLCEAFILSMTAQSLSHHPCFLPVSVPFSQDYCHLRGLGLGDSASRGIRRGLTQEQETHHHQWHHDSKRAQPSPWCQGPCNAAGFYHWCGSWHAGPLSGRWVSQGLRQVPGARSWHTPCMPASWGTLWAARMSPQWPPTPGGWRATFWLNQGVREGEVSPLPGNRFHWNWTAISFPAWVGTSRAHLPVDDMGMSTVSVWQVPRPWWKPSLLWLCRA